MADAPNQIHDTEPAPPSDPRIGTIIAGRYRVEARLGEGGMGAVYRVEHTHMRKRLAIKVLHGQLTHQPEVVARFEREAMAAANIDHPNVAAATDFGRLDDGAFYLVLEYVEGTDLRTLLESQRWINPARACHIALQILGALRRAHELGIVHRDLKPENIQLVEREGDPEFVKVLDFGIARVPVGTLGSEDSRSGYENQRPLTRAGMVYGTPEYMSPEQALGEDVDGRADLYAVGVLLFEMLSGARPFDNKDKIKLLGMHVSEPVPSVTARSPKNSYIPPELEAVVTKLLAKSPSDRYEDAGSAAEAIMALGFDAPMHGSRHPSFRGGAEGGALRRNTTSNEAAIVTVPAPTEGSVAERPPTAPFELARPTTPKPEEIDVRAMRKGGAGKWIFLLLLVGVGVFGWIQRQKVLTVYRNLTQKPAPSGSGSTTSPDGYPSVDVKDLKSATLTALGRVASGETDAGIRELEAIAKQHPTELVAVRALAQGYSTANRHKEALAQVRKLLTAFPDAAGDATLDPILTEALAAAASVDDAFAVITGPMGSHGTQILYDMAWNARPPQLQRWRAMKLLDDPAVQKSFTPGVRSAVALRKATLSCAERRLILEKNRADFDARSIPLLQEMVKPTGCGANKKTDCYPCMRKDKLIETVLAEVETRVKNASPPK